MTSSNSATRNDNLPVTQHFIAGKLSNGHGSGIGEIFNPATGQQIATVPFAGDSEITQAIEAAKKVSASWASEPPLKRARIFFKFKQLVEDHLDTLINLIVTENGKTLHDAHGEMVRALEVIEFACGAPHLMKGSSSLNVSRNVDCHTHQQPVGICVGITPFNFPAMAPMWMIPPALVCGNTFILKPSEKCPSVIIKMAELLQQAGLPDGVLSILHGDQSTVQRLITHIDVSAVSFVGSTPVAQYVYATASASGKRVQALGGAKNHAIVMPDADIEFAAASIMGGAFGNAGERCMALSAILTVGDSTADKLCKALKAQIQKLTIGPGQHNDSEMGPVISRQHLKRVKDYISQGDTAGARLVTDGRTYNSPHKGYFIGPTLFDNVTPDMSIYRDEIFGPVLCQLRLTSLEDAIALANTHPMGNGAAIFTRSGSAARKFSTEIESGMVGINVPLPVPMAYHVFGGWKQSRFGDIGMHGMDSIRFYTRQKTITTRWPENASSDAEFAMPTMK
ncbi:MAG: CoA-acylating methylmalonate-semialdehyde dehydrogenase [Alphaproteobacteria bacterium]